MLRLLDASAPSVPYLCDLRDILEELVQFDGLIIWTDHLQLEFAHLEEHRVVVVHGAESATGRHQRGAHRAGPVPHRVLLLQTGPVEVTG